MQILSTFENLDVLDVIRKDVGKRFGSAFTRFKDFSTKKSAQIAADRLQGEYGSRFVRKYFHEELQRYVDRFEIQHYQTGRLADSTDWKVSGNVGTVFQSAIDPDTGDDYAPDVAALDRAETGKSSLGFGVETYVAEMGNTYRNTLSRLLEL